MTKLEAKEALKNGAKIRHRFFLSDEFIYMKNGQLYDETGSEINQDDFWHYREHPSWMMGWEVLLN